ncbi:MAG: AAA family ATPase [Planctomycetota bacterium]
MEPAREATPDRSESGEEIRDRWSDDERVSRLLERRQAAQDAERRAALDRLGAPETKHNGGPPERPAPAARTVTRTVNPDGTVDVDVRPAVQPGGEPDARRTEARTRTVAAPAPAPAQAPTRGPEVAAPDRAAPFDRPPAQAPASGVAAPSTTARVVCIASGKGGTGKSVLATNLAILRAKQGERVLLVDFDAGLANAHLLLGLAPPYDVGHVMEGEVSARNALVEGPHGVKLLSGGVGRQTMIDPTRRELDRLFKALRPLEDEFDLILVDHGAGLSYSTVAHLAATSTLILVTNHEVTALSDGYALYKRAHMVNRSLRVGMVVNRAPDERIALDAWDRFRGASHKFLGHAPEWIGWVPADPAVPQAVQMRSPAVLSYPDSSAAVALQRIAAWPPIEHARTPVPFYEKARRALR